MSIKIALLFFVAAAFYAKAELETEYHPQAVLHYLEMEDKKMAEKVRSIVKLKEDGPKPSSSPKLPSGLPTSGIPPKIKLCIVGAVICHKRANEDACAHLACIKKTGKCLKEAGVNVCHMPPAIKKCLPVIPCCILGSKTCEEKLCCFVRFHECTKRLGDEKDGK
ncbi:uncharacterized protein [Porites lutea]|uniref:uncharacterized protein n=1 Tax=Porites lutea TaxID=51062 RepID=UPI003CC584A9